MPYHFCSRKQTQQVLNNFGHRLLLLLGSVVGRLAPFINATNIGNVDAVGIVASCAVGNFLEWVRINRLAVSLDYNMIAGIAPLLYFLKIAKYACSRCLGAACCCVQDYAVNRSHRFLLVRAVQEQPKELLAMPSPIQSQG